MNISPQDYVSAEVILADLLPAVDDEKMRAFSKGFYISKIQQCLDEISKEVGWMEGMTEVDMPDDLQVPLPRGAYNIRNLYAFTGTKCDIGNSVNLYWKRNYYTQGKGYVARDKGNNPGDPFYPNRRRPFDYHTGKAYEQIENNPVLKSENLTGVNGEFFYNVHDGIIMVSPSCKAYAKLMIQHFIWGPNIGEKPSIPRAFRMPILQWTEVEVLRVKARKDPVRWRALYLDSVRILEGSKANGSWYQSMNFYKDMDVKAREDLKEYLAKLDA